MPTAHYNSARRGFTLVEMMVVLTVSLLLMTMIAPIFRLSTRTVQVVERKLAVYEAARNVLDLIESELKLSVANERGGRWSLKRTSWLDTDTFTPVSPTPPLTPGITDTASLAYAQSRRFSDALDYVRLEGGGAGGAGANLYTQFPGGKSFPLQYPCGLIAYPEAWRASMRSTLIYQHKIESADYESDNAGNRWNRPGQLADVSQVEMAFVFYSVGDQFRGSGGNIITHYDAIPDALGPGKEARMPDYYKGDVGDNRQRRLGQFKVLDLAVSYWDDTARQFTDVPDNDVVYFWPMPKAVRVTITVCDRDKRSTVTLCRLIHLPTGTGPGGVKSDAQDTAYYTAALGSYTPAIYNRTKYMPKLPASFQGDNSFANPSSNDMSRNSETTTILYDGVKPYNWP